MGLDPSAVWDFAKEVIGATRPDRGRTLATVTRIDADGTTWVTTGDGGEAPASSVAAGVSVGDTVTLEWDGASMGIRSNVTNPSPAGSVIRRAVERTRSVADAAQRVADAVNQHFFADGHGIHVTEATQEEWDESHTGANVLINSIGQLFRDGLNNLLTLTTEGNARALTVWDGLGNAASNVRAVIGETITLGNASDGSVVTIDSDSLDMVHGTTEMLHFGYGDVASGSGTTTAPYYTLGTRNNIDFMEYNPNLTYKLGKLVTYDGAGYVCISAITTPEPWNSAHWRLAVGAYSIAEGNRLTASGTFASAEGYYTKAVGHYSHAEGIYSETYGRHSHAQNEGTIAASDNQTALGRYNVVDANSTYAVIVGNGTSDSNRSNALTVDWDGNLACNNFGAKTTSHSASSVTISAGGNYYASLGSLTAVDGFVPVGVSFNLTGMSNYTDLFPSSLQDNGTYIWARIHNFNSSSSTGSWSATVYWVASN